MAHIIERLKKTSEVARELGVPYWKLFRLVQEGKILRPSKDGSGDMVWTAADIERARNAVKLDGRRKAVPV
jgi:hypothetical protein